ncbi:MAG TPA: hypothetical protein VHC43_17690 [Mycobacteriales bacterium]|nr:hypothetical protein [Mycobacteriales bacterium]
MRVYLPATVLMLRDWSAAGVATPAGPVYAVTPSLREWYREGDAEELEHAASLLAAVASLDLLATDAGAPPRRVVLAADVDDGDGAPDQEQRGALWLRRPVPSAQWASALVDDAAAEPTVVAAVGLLRDSAANADDVDFALGEAEAAELGWYAVQELQFL